MILFTLVIAFIYLICGSFCEESSTYTTKYDGIDLEEILTNERLLTGYVKCLLDSGPCTPDGKELKKNLPDAIQNNCSKCTQRQQEGADQVMEYIIDHRPDDWRKLEEKYNSDGSYKRKYLERKQTEIKKPSHETEEENVSKNSKEDEN